MQKKNFSRNEMSRKKSRNEIRYNVVLKALSLALALELDTVGLNLNLIFHTFDTRSFD